VVEVVGPDGERTTENRAADQGGAVSVTPSRRPERPEERAADELEVAERVDREVPPSEETAGAVQEQALPELSVAAGAYEGGPLPPLAPTAGLATTPTPAPAPQAPAQMAPLAPSTAPAGHAPAARSADDLAAPSPATDEPLAAHALHQQARSLAAAGRCQESIARYEQLQARYPDYAQGGQASLEAGQCLRRLGRTSAARVALERAARSSVPVVAGAARRELVELAAEDRATTEVPTAAEAAH
jgi:tetratricopeptide (TPR) repeat protein